ncbi:MAG TPA: DUF1080 domain-containing protein [Flavitalea sp.]|nr:DUF1080 domain-containing protein [Flavitalea sp.]
MKLKDAILLLMLIVVCSYTLPGQSAFIEFGTEISTGKPGSKNKESRVKWVNVNTDPDTWKRNKDLLICSGNPIGVMRSEKQYENFILEIEWMHMEAGGNSGVFVWSDAKPGSNRLPAGVEVQMLELDWVNLNTWGGKTAPVAMVHGELFGAGGLTTIPDSARGDRSEPTENRCNGKGKWNSYVVVCVDGVVKLSVNGKFVNGISKSSSKKGFLCLESEGAAIHFRNLRITELP